ncbi:MAG: beta strand repeat-containing protein [Bacilli bacterium]|jgi:uncharacterized protein YjdB
MFKQKRFFVLVFMLLVGLLLVACDKPVAVGPGISFVDGEITMEVGAEINLSSSLTLTGIDNISLITFTTTKPGLIQISGTTIKALAAGNGTVTAALASDSSISDTVIVRITAGSNTLSALEVSAVDTFLGIGGSAMLSVTPTPATASNAVTWSSSDNTVATVSATGLVNAVGLGAATITATSSVSSSITGSINIYVNEASEPGEITINGNSSVAAGSSTQLMAAFENTYYSSVTWTSANNAIATVSASGVVTGVTQGSVIITAMAGPANEYTKTITITVTAGTGAPTINITGNSSVQVGATAQLTAQVNGGAGNVLWSSSDNEKATVSTTGLVTGIEAGPVVITATLATNPSVTATFNITVIAGGSATISISGSTSVNKNSTISLTASASVNGTPVSGTIQWSSSDVNIAIVNNGQVYGVEAGTAIITAALADNTSVYSTISIQVIDPNSGGGGGDEPTSLAITGVSGVNVGSTLQLGYTITPTPSGAVTIEWVSSNSLIASVSATGLVTGVSVGTAVIYATIEGTSVTGTANISVTNPPADPTIQASASNSTIVVGGYTQISATTDPAGADVQYTSDNTSIATVDQTGKVTGVAAGNAVITVSLVSNSAIKATVAIKVDPAPATSITLTLRLEDMSNNPVAYALIGGADTQVTITNIAQTGSSTRYDFDWSSSATNIATISSAGTITPVAAGKTTITAELKSNPQTKGSVEIQILATPPATLTLTATKTSFAVGETSQVSVTGGTAATFSLPEGDEWKASIDASTGLVTAKAPSIVVVTATSTADPLVKGTITLTITAAAGALNVKVYQSSAQGGSTGTSLTEISKAAADGGGAGYYQVYVYDSSGVAISRTACTFTTTDGNVCTVSIYGSITAVAIGGPVTIKAVYGSQEGTVTISVVA